MDVRVEQLRRFVVLAEELHFTRAAARLHIAQQVLSAQLRQLERAVGRPLFERTSRRVELTDAGQALLGYARRALADLDTGVRAARQAGSRPMVRLLCQIDAQWALADALAARHNVGPGRNGEVQVTVGYVLDLNDVSDTAGQDIDAVVGWGPSPTRLADQSIIAAVDETCIVLAESDPCATATSVRLDQLAGRTLWMWPRHVSPQAWHRLVNRVSTQPDTVVEIDAGDAPAQERMIAAVQNHGGYTVATRGYLKQMNLAGVTCVSLIPPLLTDIHLGWRGDGTPELQRLVSELGAADHPAVQ